MEEPDLTNRRSRKTGPKPAPDHGVDSAEVIPAPNKEPEELKTDTASNVSQMAVDLDGVVVQLNTRISLRYRQLLSHLSQTEGKTIRALVEEALQEKYL